MATRRTTTRPSGPLTPLDDTKTDYWHHPRTGKREISQATSADGRWHYIHDDSPGTPWLCYDTIAEADVAKAGGIYHPEWFGDLDEARAWTYTETQPQCASVAG